MTPEAREKFRRETVEHDQAFRAVLLKDIPYLHKLAVKYKDPKWLEIADTLGGELKRLSTATAC